MSAETTDKLIRGCAAKAFAADYPSEVEIALAPLRSRIESLERELAEARKDSEPWTGYVLGAVHHTEEGHKAVRNSQANRDYWRASVCVNTLAGIEHPQEWREAVEELISYLVTEKRGSLDLILQRIAKAKGTP